MCLSIRLIQRDSTFGALRFDAPTGVVLREKVDLTHERAKSCPQPHGVQSRFAGYVLILPRPHPLFAVHRSLSFFPLTIHSIISCYPEVSLHIIPCISVRSFPFSSRPRANRALQAYNDSYFSYPAPKPYDYQNYAQDPISHPQNNQPRPLSTGCPVRSWSPCPPVGHDPRV